VRITGRAKDVIKCSGYSVFAREVEEALSSHPAVARCAVFGSRIPRRRGAGGGGGVPAQLPPLGGELLAWGQRHLAAYKAPRRVYLVEQGGLPQGVTEKVLKRVLRERYAAEPSTRRGPD